MTYLPLSLGLVLLFGSGAWAETNLKSTCDPKSCSTVKPPCGKNESAVEVKDENSCCPHFLCRADKPRAPKNCGGAVCDMIVPSCGQGQESVNKASPGACCPKYSCVDKKL